MDGQRSFEELVEAATSDQGVIGLFLLGSRGKDVFVHEDSDYDVGVVLRDAAALARFDRQHPFERGSRLEILTNTLEGLREHAAYGSNSEWARYQYAHVRVLVDKTGEVRRIIEAKELVPDNVREERVPQLLDAFINAYLRSAKNRLVGLERAARLDAAECIPPLLDAIFMLEGRIRPYNKYLEWELMHHPLVEPCWAATNLLPQLEAILEPDAIEAQRDLFRDVERVARAHSYGAVLDGWNPDLPWLRGEVAGVHPMGRRSSVD